MLPRYTSLLLSLAILGGCGKSTSPEQPYLARLNGKYPTEGASTKEPAFFSVAPVNQAFERSVPKKWRQAALHELTTTVPNTLVAGYLVVSGCKPHACPDKNYVAVANLDGTDTAFVFYDMRPGKSELAATRCYSAQPNLNHFPSAVRQEIASRRDADDDTWVEKVHCSPGKG